MPARLISQTDCFAQAFLWEDPSMINRSLDVRISTLAKPTNKCCTRILDFLAGVCVQQTYGETVEDDAWAGCEYQRTGFTVFAECPGSDTDHICRVTRSGMEQVGREITGG
jgi:hypothetical protein